MSEKDKLGILSELTALQAAIDKYIDEITTKNAEIGEKSRIILGELSSIKSYRDKIFNNMGMIIEFTCDKGINNPEVKAYRNVINMSLNALNNLDNTIDKLSNLSYGCISDAKQILLELDEYRNEINNPLKSDKMIDVTISSYERYVEEKVQPMINVLAAKLKDGNIEKIDDISKKIDDIIIKMAKILESSNKVASSIKNLEKITIESELKSLDKIPKLINSITNIIKSIKSLVGAVIS